MTPAHELTREQFNRARGLKEAHALCVEIGLETFGRKPHEMRETTSEWKLQRAQKLVRQIAALIKDSHE